MVVGAANERAITLYERAGFVNVDEVRNYFLAGGALDRLASFAVPLARKTG